MIYKLIALGLVILFTIFLHIDLQKQNTSFVNISASDSDIKYLPLGDSYTIGEDVIESER